MWPDRRLLDLFKIEVPIVQAPMAGAQDADIMIGAAQGGALASLPCAMIASAPLSSSQRASRTIVADEITRQPASLTRLTSPLSGRPK